MTSSPFPGNHCHAPCWVGSPYKRSYCSDWGQLNNHTLANSALSGLLRPLTGSEQQS